jgi:antitoxin VapB
METAKLFMNGQSQAVRLPKECRFSGDEVGIKKVGDMVLLFQKENTLSAFLGAPALSDDAEEAIFTARSEHTEPKRENL